MSARWGTMFVRAQNIDGREGTRDRRTDRGTRAHGARALGWSAIVGACLAAWACASERRSQSVLSDVAASPQGQTPPKLEPPRAVRSSTATVEGAESEPAAILSSETRRDSEEVDSGSSVRALGAKEIVAVAGGASASVSSPSGLTPARYLRVSACLVSEDIAKMYDWIGRGGERDRVGRLTRVLEESERLVEDVLHVLGSKGLRSEGGLSVGCNTEPPEALARVRDLLGPPVEGEAGVSAYEQGLVRLRRELVLKFGLPKER